MIYEPDDPARFAEMAEAAEFEGGSIDQLFTLVYDELRRNARRRLRRERPNHTLQTTALVHEAYLKLAAQTRLRLKNRGHFFAIAGEAMRRILVDHARTRHRGKRGGRDENLPLKEALCRTAESMDIDLVALDEALTRLSTIDELEEKIVEMRFFAGLSLEETADALGISRATVSREWAMAKAWLHRELTR